MPGVETVREEDKNERLKAALWYSIGNTIDAISLEQDINASPRFIGALTELVWTQIASASQDIEAFTRHAERTVIDVPDVMLLSRRNPSLEMLLRSLIEESTSMDGRG